MRVRREMIVELQRLRCRGARRFVGHAGVHQERRRRVFQRTRFTVGQAGRVRVVPVESLQFHRRQLEKRTTRGDWHYTIFIAYPPRGGRGQVN